VWRDAIDNWFHRISGVDDKQGRVGHHPHRTEAELMRLRGYEVFEPASWESASGGKAVTCPEKANSCSAETGFSGESGRYEIGIEYFDVSDGVCQFRVFVNGKVIDSWRADQLLPGREPSADSSVRRRINGLQLRNGDVIRVEGYPDGAERAAFDYIEIVPSPQD
jgi:alpha-glucuronidase